MLYMWLRYGKPDASMTGNGLLAGLVAITAPSGFVNPVGAVIIGLIAGVLVCLSVEFVEKVMKVDDPVGAISVHGTNGLWGVISVGLFADGKSNYGGSWNGVDGNVKGLFYGDAGQLVAQLIGCRDAYRLRVHLQLRRQLDHRYRSSASASAPKTELEGLDMPEMGALCYPEFEMKTQSVGAYSDVYRTGSSPAGSSGTHPGLRAGADPAGSVAGPVTRSRKQELAAHIGSSKRPARKIPSRPICEPAWAWLTP